MKISPDGESTWNRPFKMFLRLVETVSFGVEICGEVFHCYISVEKKFVIFGNNLCIFNENPCEIESKLFGNLSRLLRGFVDFVCCDQEP